MRISWTNGVEQSCKQTCQLLGLSPGSPGLGHMSVRAVVQPNCRVPLQQPVLSTCRSWSAVMLPSLIFVTLLARLQNVLFNSASPCQGGFKIHHITGGLLVLGILSSKLIAQLRDCTFRSPLLMEAIKPAFSLCLGHCLLCISSNPCKRLAKVRELLQSACPLSFPLQFPC